MSEWLTRQFANHVRQEFEMADKISIDKITGVQFLDLNVVQRYNTPQNPLEDGTPIIDHRVRLPKEITVMCLVKKDKNASATLGKIAEARTCGILEGERYSITDKLGEEHKNMVLVNYSHKENFSDKFDNYYFELMFREIITAKQKTVKYAPKDTDNSAMLEM